MANASGSYSADINGRGDGVSMEGMGSRSASASGSGAQHIAHLNNGSSSSNGHVHTKSGSNSIAQLGSTDVGPLDAAQRRGDLSPRSPNGMAGQQQLSQAPTSPLYDEELPEPICGGCKKLIDEDSADAGVIHFATQLWHVDCFRCAKCHNPVTTDRDDILLLSDGHPICGQCNYSCQICNLPIMEEAIMTGDESYHASCFVCRSCKTPIAELVFAKTSQGIYCMNCHNQRVARSRRHAEKKRQAAAAAAASAAAASGSGSDATRGTPRIDNQKHHTQDAASLAPTIAESSPSLSSPGMPSQMADAQKQKLSADGDELGRSSPRTGPLQPIQAPSSPAASSARRPLNPPPPPSLRSLRQRAERPSTSESSSHDLAARAPQSRSSPNALSEAPSDSPLFFGAKAAAQQRSTTMSKFSQDQGRLSSEDVAPLRRSAEDTWRVQDVGGMDPHRKEGSSRSVDRQGLGVAPMHLSESTKTLSKDSAGHTALDVDPNAVRSVQSTDSTRYLGVQPVQGDPPITKSFSFYDPDIVSIMDSFARLESSDDLSSDGISSSREFAQTKPGDAAQQGEPKQDDVAPSRRGMDESSRPVLDEEIPAIAASPELDHHDKGDTSHGSLPRSASIAERMRQSLQGSRSEGKVKMDKAVLGSLLEEFDRTHERMKALQQKYDRIRRASQQAAQGFSSAREEYEQEVRARYDAEAELLTLKREVHVQAMQLAELTAEKRQQEKLRRHTQEIKSAISGLERELSKLKIEREVQLAEIAGLVAVQDPRSLVGGAHEENIKRSLMQKMEGVREGLRVELQELLDERDRLSNEVESLQQAREHALEEGKMFATQNEELQAALAHTQQRLEHAQAAEKLVLARAAHPAPTPSPGSTRSQQGFAFGLRGKPATSIASSSTVVDGVHHDESIGYAAPVPIAKAEAAPKKFKWMKGSKLMTGEAARAVLQNGVNAFTPPALPPKNGATSNASTTSRDHAQTHNREVSNVRQDGAVHLAGNRQASTDGQAPGVSNGSVPGEIVYKEHLFQPLNILRPIRCFACQKNMWGQSELRCQFCNQACHVKCLNILPTSCNQPYMRNDEASEPTGPSMFGRRLTEQARAEGASRTVPLIVQRCVETVEKQGMDYEGIYRKSGGTSQLKIITQLFEKGQPFDLDDRNRFNDVSAITSVLKNYFRELPEPLLTFELHERFVECVENKSLDAATKRSTMHELVHSLPREHFDTLKLLVTHLHRIALRAEENRMSSRNLGVVFGPTLMRSSDPTQEFAHMGGKAMAIEYMIDNCDVFD